MIECFNFNGMVIDTGWKKTITEILLSEAV